MKTRLAKWGNSLAVRIPKPIADAAQLNAGDKLELDVEAPGALTIRKPKQKPSLPELVREITSENRHSESDWGRPEGNEIW
jgi:antitoxin MazE